MEIEIKAQVEDRFITAVGVVSAIAQIFGKKRNKSLENFRKMIEGQRTRSGGSADSASSLRAHIMENLPAGVMPPDTRKAPDRDH